MNKLTINGKTFEWGSKTYIMGIINVTPDSFSGDGLLKERNIKENALRYADLCVKNHVDIIDVGGESTRPGADAVSANEEIERIVPVIESITDNFDVLVSVDTYKSEVAKHALNAGACMINDVWGLQVDEKLAGLATQYKIPIILMHNRSTPKDVEINENMGGRYVGIAYQNMMEEIKDELNESINKALNYGVEKKNIIIDPGIGFGKTVGQNLELINKLDYIKKLGYPILIGVSRKSFIGYTLNLPPDDRIEGTAAAIAVSIVRGADIIRVHDVIAMSRVAKMVDAIVR